MTPRHLTPIVAVLLVVPLAGGGIWGWRQPPQETLTVVAVPESVPIPPVVDHDGDPEFPAVFEHWTHDQYQCYVCHPALFPRRRRGFTHDQMDEGRFCGACHDGQAAFHPQNDDVECSLCHRPL